MMLRQVLALAMLAGVGALFTPGCSVLGDTCNYDEKRCTDTTGGYETCSGGEGYYYWSSGQCPGVDPACTGDGQCSERAKFTSCAATLVVPGGASTISASDASVLPPTRLIDVDGDGLLDLFPPVQNGVLRVALGKKDGTFAEIQEISLTVEGQAMDALPANLDGDGIEDLVVSSGAPSELYAFLGDSALHYHLGARYFAGFGLEAASDLDGDGRDEVLTASADILSKLGEPKLEDHSIDVAQGGAYSSGYFEGVEFVEANGKPPLEVAFRNAQDITIFSRKSDGSFEISSTLHDSYLWGGGTLGDLDGDGRADLLSRSDDVEVNHLNVHLSKNGFSVSSALVTVYTGQPYLGDFDNDGDVDIFLAASDANSDPIAEIYKGDGKGNFADAELFSLPKGTSVVAAGDVGGDGKDDVVLNDDTGALYVVRGGCIGK